MKIFISLLLLFLFSGNQLLSQNDTNAVKKLLTTSQKFAESFQADSELIYLNRSLALSQKLGYKKGISSSLSAIGTIFMHKGEYPKALDFFFKSLTLNESISYKQGILINYGNIGIIYDYQGDFEKALGYYDKALRISEKLKDSIHVSIQLCNKAIVYCNQSKFNEALICFNQAFKIDSLLNDKSGMARNTVNIGNVYNSLKMHDEALVKMKQALSLAEELKDNNMILTNLLNIAWINADLKKNAVAEEYFMKASALSKQVDDQNLKSEVEISLSEFYTEIGRDNLALEHYKKHIVLRDSVYNSENTKKSMASEMNYEFDKKQAAVKFEHDKVVYKLESENKLHKQLRLFFIVSIILVLVLLFFAKRAYDNKKKIAEFMASESNRKEVLLQEVHHRINNNLQIISSLLTLQANSADDEKLTAYLTQSQNRIQSLSVLHELLFDTNSPLEINMRDYINKVLDFHRQVSDSMAGKITIEESIDPINFPTKLAVPLALIVNELVTNSLKYAFINKSEGVINVNLSKNKSDDNWHLIISDNGKGLPDDSKKRKDSLGLKLVTIMTKQIGGNLIAKNDNGAFFSVIFNRTKI
jgi:two-component sensor histidine kinase